VRVLDFGIGGVGPWAGSQLAQLGAIVIKVEAPNEFILQVLPPWRGLTTTYACLNLGKRSARLNLKEAEDRERAWRLLEAADVLIENFRSGAMARLGFGFEEVAGRNPRIVYCSSTGFGSRGAMAGLACTDPHMQAFSGFAALNGSRPTGERMRYYAAIDLYTSTVIVEAVLAALIERERGGGPQKVEMTMLGAATNLMLTQWAEHLAGGPPPGPLGPRGRHAAPDGIFRARDGALAVTAETDVVFAALCHALEREDLLADPRFATPRARLEAAAALHAELGRTLAGQPVDWWLAALRRAGVPCARVQLDHEAAVHRESWSRGHLRELRVEEAGTLRAAGPPWDFEGVEAVPAQAPRPGQDTATVAKDPAGVWERLSSTP
jgi:crotonobetainyl-CoA:carnitine CoA-transferase CaiB-like acyl-CoA transferase